MPKRNARTARTDAATPERRTRVRLRELCDEVIASHRMATGGELIAGDDRESARAVLASIVPASLAGRDRAAAGLIA